MQADELILVDADDNVIGHETKDACHDGDGLLHRAFSVFLFNAAGEVLLQQRSASKRLWPLYWANSCCSHPRRGESIADAAKRRVSEELGLDTEPRYLYKFSYHAHYERAGAERELCSVLIDRVDEDPPFDPTEVHSVRWLLPEAMDAELETHPEALTPWLKLEWRALRAEHWPAVTALATSPAAATVSERR